MQKKKIRVREVEYNPTLDALTIETSEKETFTITNISEKISYIGKDERDNSSLWANLERDTYGIYLPAMDLDIALKDLLCIHQKRPLKKPIGFPVRNRKRQYRP